MRLSLEATPTELNEKGEQLIRSLMETVAPLSLELAERLEKALPEKKVKLRQRALRDIHEQTKAEYRKTLDRMVEAIGKVLTRAGKAPSFERLEKGERADHKYIERTGEPGNYRYTYPDESGRERGGEQLDLFAEAKALGVDVPAYFPSGSNHAGEIHGFADLGWNVGVAVDALDKQGNAEKALKDLAGSKTKVFVDSGAFGEVKPNFPNEKGERPYPEHPIGLAPVKPISHEEWLERLATYDRLADALGKQLYVVAPDQVGNQDVTFQRLQRYLPQVKALQEKGANVLVPLQKGAKSMAEFDRDVAKLLGTDDFVRAIPMKKDATSTEDLRKLLADHPIPRIHLLGLGEKSERYPEIMAMLEEVSPKTKVTLDSVAITAAVGRPENGPPRKLTAAQDRARKQLETEVFHETVNGLDYTDNITQPEGWASPTLRKWGAQVMGLSAETARAFVKDPDGWVAENANHPMIDQALDAMWQKWALEEGTVAEKKRRAVREAFGPSGVKPKQDYQDVTAPARKEYQAAVASGDKGRIERARAGLFEDAYQHAFDVHNALQTKELSPKEYEQRHEKVFGPREKFNPNDLSWKPVDPDLHKFLDDSDFWKAYSGPFIGPRGGKWADPEHTIPWKEGMGHENIHEAVYEDAAGAVKSQVVNAAFRAVHAGADPQTVKYVGAGAQAIIFTDKSGRAYRVLRTSDPLIRSESVRNEQEAIEALKGTPAEKHMPTFYHADPEHGVVVRSMVAGHPGGWGTKGIREAYDLIQKELRKQEFTSPEAKEDSFVVPEDGGPLIMVDLGFMHPLGKRSARRMEELLAKRDPKLIDLLDQPFEIRNLLFEKAITWDDAVRMSAQIKEIKQGQAGWNDATWKSHIESLEHSGREAGELAEGEHVNDGPRSKAANLKPTEKPKRKRKPVKAKTEAEKQRARVLQDGYDGGILTPEMKLEDAEKAINGQKIEHCAVYDGKGNMLVRIKGGEDFAHVVPVVAKRIKEDGNVTFTHNHPTGNCFSPEDIMMAVGLNMKEIRAVGKFGTFVLRRPEKGWTADLDHSIIQFGHPDGSGRKVEAHAWMFDVLEAMANGSEAAKKSMDERLERVDPDTPKGPGHPAYSEEKWHEFCSEENARAFAKACKWKLGWDFEVQKPGSDRGQPVGAGDQPGREQSTEVSAPNPGAEFGLSPEPPAKPKPKRRPVKAKTPEPENAPLPGQRGLFNPQEVTRKKPGKPKQQVLFPEPEKQEPGAKPLPGQRPLFQ